MAVVVGTMCGLCGVVVVLLVGLLSRGGSGLIARPSLPPRGWNSWDSFGASNESVTLEIAAVLAKKLAPSGYTYLTIDEGWFENADGSMALDRYGRLIPSTDMYPNSQGNFSSLALTLHNMGLSFGIWTMFGIPVDAVKQRLPIKDSPFTADQIALNESTTCPWKKGFTYSVNTSHPGGQAYYRSLVELYEGWGMDLIKMDCTFAVDMTPEHFDDMKTLSHFLNASDHTFVLSLSPGAHTNESALAQVQPYATMARVTNDFWDVYNDLPDEFPSSVVSHFDIAYRLQGFKPSAGFYLDFDMLPFGRVGQPHAPHSSRPSQLTLTEQQMVMTLWCLCKSPLIAGGDLRVATDDDLSVLNESDILDMQKYASDVALRYIQLEDGPVEFWAGDNTDPEAGVRAHYLAIFNLGNNTANIDVHFAKLGFGNGKFGLLEQWTGLPASPSTRIQTAIQPHSVLAYKASYFGDSNASDE